MGKTLYIQSVEINKKISIKIGVGKAYRGSSRALPPTGRDYLASPTGSCISFSTPANEKHCSSANESRSHPELLLSSNQLLFFFY